LYAIGVVLVGVVCGFFLEQFINYQSVAILLLFIVLWSSLILERGPMLLIAILSAVLWEFFFIEPRFTFQIRLTQDYLMLALYFVVAVVMGTLTGRLSSRERAISQREERTNALYSLTRDLSKATTIDGVVGAAIAQISEVFGAQVAVYLLDDNNELSKTAHPLSTITFSDQEFGVIGFVFQDGRTAGRFTQFLPSSEAQHFPLRAPGRTVGVVSIKTSSSEALPADLEDLLEAFISQIALAVERELLDKAASRAEVLAASERLYTTLLSSISHEVRTPLAAISGATSGLMDATISADPQTRQMPGQDIQDATARLNRLIGNLLEITRLESDRLTLNLQWTEVSDLIDASLRQVEKELINHQLKLQVPVGLPLIRIDFVLMEHALTNLLHNAAIYTPPNTQITLQARIEGEHLLLIVSDNGPGLPENGTHVFEKFYRGPGVAAGGTGLGLSIVRGLIEAHHGTIEADNQTTGGARFVIRLPLEALPEMIEEKEL
jgi:two-component system sensor histidine kinase KdpD